MISSFLLFCPGRWGGTIIGRWAKSKFLSDTPYECPPMPPLDDFRCSVFVNDEEHAVFQLRRFSVDIILSIPTRS